jgi:hypothetical protein
MTKNFLTKLIGYASNNCHLKHLQVSETIKNVCRLTIQDDQKVDSNTVELKESKSYFFFVLEMYRLYHRLSLAFFDVSVMQFSEDFMQCWPVFHRQSIMRSRRRKRQHPRSRFSIVLNFSNKKRRRHYFGVDETPARGSPSLLDWNL